MYKIVINFFYFSFFTIFIFQIGSYLSYKLKNKAVGEYRSLNFLFGIFLIGSTIVGVNFFLPTSSYITYVLLVLLFALSYKALIPVNYILKIILINLIVYPICLKMSFAFDAGLYHLPYQNILRSEKIIFGLANMPRYGFSSFQEYLGSIVFSSNFIFHKFIVGSFLSFFCLFLDDLRKSKLNFDNIYFYYSLISLPFLSRYFSIYTTLTDLASGLLLIIQFYFAIKIFLILNIKKKIDPDNIQIFILLTFLCVAYKASSSTSALLFLILMMLLIKSFKFLKLVILKNIFLFFFIFLWLLKNIIISGCLVYPIEISCFEFFDWHAFEQANDDAKAIMSWNRQPFVGYEKTLQSTDWFFEYWIKTYDKFILSSLYLLLLTFIFNFIFSYFKENIKIYSFYYALFPFIILLTFQSETFDFIKGFLNLKIYVVFAFLSLATCVLIFYNYRKVIIKNITIDYKYSLIFFTYILLAIVLWFYNAPNPRLGFGYIYCLFIFFGLQTYFIFNGSQLILNYSVKLKKSNLFFLYFFMIIIFSQSEMYSTRYSVYNFFNNSFWTNKLTYNYGLDVNIPLHGNDIEVKKRKNFGFEPKGGQCWFAKDCYVGRDVIQYEIALNYRKFKPAP